MRLGDMNNLGAKRLNEDMQKRVGWNFGNINKLTVAQASAMLESIDGKIAKFKNSNQLHESEKNTSYNGLILAKQVLETYIAEKADSATAGGYSKKHVEQGLKLYRKAKAQDALTSEAEDYVAHIAQKKFGFSKEEARRFADYIVDRDINLDYASGPKSSLDKENMHGAIKRDLASESNLNKNHRISESYSAQEQMVADTFDRVESRLLAMAKVMREDGALAKNVQSVGGDASYLRDAYRSILSAYDDVEEAHRGALGHVMDESAAQGMFEDEVGQAETIMAAQDMVDSIQGMLEDVGEMINEKLPPLTDSIRRSGGAEAAATFNQQTNSALNALMDAVRTARESMATAVGTLSGEAPTPMGGDAGGDDFDLDLAEPADTVDAGDDLETDDFEASDAAMGGDEPLGRAKRN